MSKGLSELGKKLLKGKELRCRWCGKGTLAPKGWYTYAPKDQSKVNKKASNVVRIKRNGKYLYAIRKRNYVCNRCETHQTKPVKVN